MLDTEQMVALKVLELVILFFEGQIGLKSSYRTMWMNRYLRMGKPAGNLAAEAAFVLVWSP